MYYGSSGPEVISIGVNPDGYNINKGCGSTHPQNAAKAVLEHNAHVGICLDGDADRLILIDNKGNIADGDQLMGLIASQWSSKGKLGKQYACCNCYVQYGFRAIS